MGEKLRVWKHICKGIGFYCGVSELLNVSHYMQVYWLDKKAIDEKNAVSIGNSRQAEIAQLGER